jgi:hypothetical protein
VAFRVILSDQARHRLSQLTRPILDTILDCLNEIQADPYRDPDLRVTLVIPLYRIYPAAYLCGNWAIAYEVRRQDQVLIEEIGNHFY